MLLRSPNLTSIDLSSSDSSRDIGQYLSHLKLLKNLNLSNWQLKEKDLKSMKGNLLWIFS